MRNHQKTDRMLGIARDQRCRPCCSPKAAAAGRAIPTRPVVAGLHVRTFASYARLNGQVPVVGIVAGRCFAGNAALRRLQRRDHRDPRQQHRHGRPGDDRRRRARRPSRPRTIGPSDVQRRNGVIDMLVDDEAAAVRRAALPVVLPGRAGGPGCSRPACAARRAAREPRARLRHARRAAARRRHRFAARAARRVRRRHPDRAGRIEGRPVGVLANNPAHLGGAIDADAADKAARFMQLCNAHGLPIVSLVDTPGFMVGPEIETRAQVRHVSRMFVVAAHLRVPFFAVVLRKGYGLGAMAMTGGGFHATGGDGRMAERRVRRDGPRGRGAARLPQGAAQAPPRAPSAMRCTRGWWPSSTRAARRSTWRRPSRSTR